MVVGNITNYQNYSTNMYKISTSGEIFVLDKYKQPYQSSQYDRIIGKWHQYLLGGQKWN